jgi:hypothetical protein
MSMLVFSIKATSLIKLPDKMAALGSFKALNGTRLGDGDGLRRLSG